MVQTQSLTMLGYVGSPCADNRLASSFTVWYQIFFSFNVFRAIHYPILPLFQDWKIELSQQGCFHIDVLQRECTLFNYYIFLCIYLPFSFFCSASNWSMKCISTGESSYLVRSRNLAYSASARS